MSSNGLVQILTAGTFCLVISGIIVESLSGLGIKILIKNTVKDYKRGHV